MTGYRVQRVITSHFFPMTLSANSGLAATDIRSGYLSVPAIEARIYDPHTLGLTSYRCPVLIIRRFYSVAVTIDLSQVYRG